jgi:hypothetical protein
MEIEVKMVEWFDDHFYKVVYQKDGKDVVDYIPSVTTKIGAVSKPFLTQWYGDLGTREANLRKMEQADRGSRLHLAWQIFTQGGLVIFNDYRRPAYTLDEISAMEKEYNGMICILRSQEEMYQMTKLQKFIAIVKPTSILSEQVVYDIDNRDAGTLDNLLDINAGEYFINGKKPVVLEAGKYIFDLKTGNYLGDEAELQVADYAKCAEKMGLGPIKGAIIGHTASRNKGGIEGFGVVVLDAAAIERRYQTYRNVAKVWEDMFGTMKPDIFEIPTIIKREG